MMPVAKRNHPLFPSPQEIEVNNSLLYSDHLPVLFTVPVADKNINVVSWNIMKFSGPSGFHTRSGWENDADGIARHNRIGNALKSFAANLSADVIVLQEATLAMFNPALSEIFPESEWIIKDEENGRAMIYRKSSLSPVDDTYQNVDSCRFNQEDIGGRQKLLFDVVGTDHQLDLMNVHSIFNAEPSRHERGYRGWLEEAAKNEKIVPVLVGDTNTRVAPASLQLMNITTGAIPLPFNAIEEIPASIQRTDFPDAAFMRTKEGKVVSLERIILNPYTGDRYQAEAIEGDLALSWNEARPLACVDDESRQLHKELFELEQAFNAIFPDSNLILRPTAKDNNARGFSLWISNTSKFYQEARKTTYANTDVFSRQIKNCEYKYTPHALVTVSTENKDLLLNPIRALVLESFESSLITAPLEIKENFPALNKLQQDVDQALTASRATLKLYPITDGPNNNGVALWVDKADPFYAILQKYFQDDVFIKTIRNFGPEDKQGLWISVNRENKQLFIDKLRLLIKNIIRENQRKNENLNDKFFVFDRDQTLIDRDEKLINPEFIERFLLTLTENKTPWAIASAGATELKVDPAYVPLIARVPDLSEPSYVQFNRINSVLKHAISFENVDFALNAGAPNLTENVKAQIALNTAYKMNPFTLNQLIALPENLGNIIFKANSKVHFKLGEIEIVVNLPQFIEQLDNLEKGDYKLFMIFLALDQKQCTLALNDGLKQFGIESIVAPNHYRTIQPENVVMLDDKDGVCELMQLAGITAVKADTGPEASTVSQNTYLSKLEATLPIAIKRTQDFNTLYADVNLEATTVISWNTINTALVNYEKARVGIIRSGKDSTFATGLKNLHATTTANTPYKVSQLLGLLTLMLNAEVSKTKYERNLFIALRDSIPGYGALLALHQKYGISNIDKRIIIAIINHTFAQKVAETILSNMYKPSFSPRTLFQIVKLPFDSNQKWMLTESEQGYTFKDVGVAERVIARVKAMNLLSDELKVRIENHPKPWLLEKALNLLRAENIEARFLIPLVINHENPSNLAKAFCLLKERNLMHIVSLVNNSRSPRELAICLVKLDKLNLMNVFSDRVVHLPETFNLAHCLNILDNNHALTVNVVAVLLQQENHDSQAMIFSLLNLFNLINETNCLKLIPISQVIDDERILSQLSRLSSDIFNQEFLDDLIKMSEAQLEIDVIRQNILNAISSKTNADKVEAASSTPASSSSENLASQKIQQQSKDRSILGASPSASYDEIRSKYKKRLVEMDPETNPLPEAKDRFAEMQDAYMRLRN